MSVSPVRSKSASPTVSAVGFHASLAKANEAATSGEVFRLPVTALMRIWGAYFGREVLHEIVAPERTLARRLAKHELLTAPETDRAVRLARVASEAERVVGDPEKAANWLRRNNRALGAHTPLELLASEAGARAVEEVLIRIDHGMFEG